MTLKDLGIGRTATVEAVGGEGALRQHFLDMGLIPGTEIICSVASVVDISVPCVYI